MECLCSIDHRPPSQHQRQTRACLQLFGSNPVKRASKHWSSALVRKIFSEYLLIQWKESWSLITLCSLHPPFFLLFLAFFTIPLREWSYLLALVYREVSGQDQPQSSTPGTGTQHMKDTSACRKLSVWALKDCVKQLQTKDCVKQLQALSAGTATHTFVCIACVDCIGFSWNLHILLVCFFLIKLVRPQYCISSPHWVLLWVTTHRELRVALWPPSEEHWPIALESQEE